MSAGLVLSRGCRCTFNGGLGMSRFAAADGPDGASQAGGEPRAAFLDAIPAGIDSPVFCLISKIPKSIRCRGCIAMNNPA